MKAAGAVLVVIFFSGSAAAQMYKCVDARGITHYADKPTAGCANAAVDIRGSPPLSGRLAPADGDPAQQEADFRRRQIERSEAERSEREQRAAAASRCAQLREERGRLASGRRLVRIDAQGEQAFVDDDTRARRLAEVEQQLALCR